MSVGLWWGAVWSGDLVANGMPRPWSTDDDFSSPIPTTITLKRKRCVGPITSRRNIPHFSIEATKPMSSSVTPWG